MRDSNPSLHLSRGGLRLAFLDSPSRPCAVGVQWMGGQDQLWKEKPGPRADCWGQQRQLVLGFPALPPPPPPARVPCLSELPMPPGGGLLTFPPRAATSVHTSHPCFNRQSTMSERSTATAPMEE